MVLSNPEIYIVKKGRPNDHSKITESNKILSTGLKFTSFFYFLFSIYPAVNKFLYSVTYIIIYGLAMLKVLKYY